MVWSNQPHPFTSLTKTALRPATPAASSHLQLKKGGRLLGDNSY